MDRSIICGKNYSPLLTLVIASISFLVFSSAGLAQNPNSATTTTGQLLTCNIISPTDGEIFPGGPPCQTDVQGLVTISAVEPQGVSVIYVIDVSGSTTDPSFHPPVDVNGDGLINAGDDFNGDGNNGDILDAEIAGGIALNASIGNLPVTEAGIIAFASNAASADCSPATGFQVFISPPQADLNGDVIPDIEEVLRSLNSDLFLGGEIGLFEPISSETLGNSTNFEAALQAILDARSQSNSDNKLIVFFLSDGKNEIGDPLDDLISELASAGVMVNTIGITSASDPTDLTAIANGTGGTFMQVDDPAELPIILPDFPVAGISGVTVNGQPVELNAIGGFSTTASLPGGIVPIECTALADDQTVVTASIGVECVETGPEGDCITFDSVQVGQEFGINVGNQPGDDLFTENNIAVSIHPFIQGGQTFFDKAIIQSQSQLSSPIGTGKVATLEGVSLRFDFTALGFLFKRVTFDFLNKGPSSNIAINDQPVIVDDLENLSGQIVAGVEVTVAQNTNGSSTVTLIGPITILLVGGVEFDIDTICCAEEDLPLTCSVDILFPDDGVDVCAGETQIIFVATSTGGRGAVTRTCTVNGVAVPASGDTVVAMVDIELGANEIVVACTCTDEQGNQASAMDTVTVFGLGAATCVVDIITPNDSALVCDPGQDGLEVKLGVELIPGAPVVDVQCEVNGVPTDASFTANVPLVPGENKLIAVCTVTDSCGNVTVCADTITVFRSEAVSCVVDIIAPKEGALLCDPGQDGLEVKLEVELIPGAPVVDVKCEVNGVPTDASFVANVPLVPGENVLIAICTVTDSCGNITTCTDTIRVLTPEAPECIVEITSPQDGAVFCTNQTTIEAMTSITGGVSPVITDCQINGIEVEADINNVFSADISLGSGANEIIATCTIIDSCGSKIVCSDTVTVFFDDVPPTCSFAPENGSIKGVFSDEGSGIGQIVPKRLRNGILTIDPDPAVEPGAKEVTFRIDPIDPGKTIGFVIDVFDVCGNRFNCDPVFASLSTDGRPRQLEFTFPAADRYFQLNNRGLTEIRVDLNGNKFSLYTDAGRTVSEINAFHIPKRGDITIDLVDHLVDGENRIFIAYEGPSGASADLLLLDIVDEVDLSLELEALPEEFQLAQNYPNPFNPTTKIQFDIPVSLGDGVPVQLRVYNLLGELVKTLVDEQKFAGRYLVEWDALDEQGVRVSSGIYIYQLVAGEFRQTNRMLLLK